MTIEICVQTMTGYRDTLELARWCEAEGVPALAVADHYLAGPDRSRPAHEQLVILGGIARETTNLELSTLVSPLTFRHPAVHLKAATTLDEMSCGRFSLGVGTGWMQLEHESFGIDFPPMSERFDRLEETLAYLRAGVDGSGFEGEYYRLAPFLPEPVPANLRLVVGGGGARRTPDLAGRYADEFNVFPSEVPVTQRVARFREAAASAGRDAGSLRLSMALPAAIAPDRATVDAMVERRAARMGVDARDAAASLDRLEIPWGTPEQASDRFDRLAATGIGRVYLQISGASPEEIGAAVTAARAAADQPAR